MTASDTVVIRCQSLTISMARNTLGRKRRRSSRLNVWALGEAWNETSCELFEMTLVGLVWSRVQRGLPGDQRVDLRRGCSRPDTEMATTGAWDAAPLDLRQTAHWFSRMAQLLRPKPEEREFVIAVSAHSRDRGNDAGARDSTSHFSWAWVHSPARRGGSAEVKRRRPCRNALHAMSGASESGFD